MGACNQEERFWNFYGGVVTRRHSLGFFQKRQKWKILIFRFCRYRGFRGEALTQSLDFSNGKVRPSGIGF